MKMIGILLLCLVKLAVSGPFVVVLVAFDILLKSSATLFIIFRNKKSVS